MQKVLGRRFEQENLVVVISVVRQITALLTNQFVMQRTEGYVVLAVEVTEDLLVLLPIARVGFKVLEVASTVVSLKHVLLVRLVLTLSHERKHY